MGKDSIRALGHVCRWRCSRTLPNFHWSSGLHRRVVPKRSGTMHVHICRCFFNQFRGVSMVIWIQRNLAISVGSCGGIVFMVSVDSPRMTPSLWLTHVATNFKGLCCFSTRRSFPHLALMWLCSTRPWLGEYPCAFPFLRFTLGLLSCFIFCSTINSTSGAENAASQWPISVWTVWRMLFSKCLQRFQKLSH